MNIIETITIEFDSYELISVTDFALEKKAVARLKLIKNIDFLAEKLITIWEGSDYDKAGQWTDTDIKNQINLILNK